MILQIQHETRLDYSTPVSEWLTEVRMEPVSDERQSCHSFHLGVSQPASVFHYQDGFGNRVHHFNLLTPHQQVRILAASVVETEGPRTDVSQSRAVFPLIVPEAPPDLATYLRMRGPVRRSKRLDALVEKLAPAALLKSPQVRIVDWLERVCNHLFTHFEYAKAVTHVSSPVDDVLAIGKGVCQDFAHLMIAILRSHAVPARYVSGYIHRPNKESQSHAWCEAWLPDLGWLGIDPTNDRFVDDHFVKVAIGRDFTDVTPNKGIYRGNGQETMWVRVESQEVKRLPSLSWRDNLPPLDVPLTAIARRRRQEELADEQMQQQQQQ